MLAIVKQSVCPISTASRSHESSSQQESSQLTYKSRCKPTSNRSHCGKYARNMASPFVLTDRWVPMEELNRPLNRVYRAYTASVFSILLLSNYFNLYRHRLFYRAPDVPKLLEDELVVKIARTHGKSPAQVLLRHMIQQDVIVIPKSVTKKRIEENLNVS